MTFAEKLALPDVVCGWGMDSSAQLNTFGVATTHPITYCWGSGGSDPVCDLADPGGMGNGSITLNRGVGERLCLAYGVYPDGICHYPVVDNTTYYAAGGGTGSLKFTVPSQSGQGTGGYFWVPYKGLGTTYYIGPDNANGGIMYQQWYEMVDDNFITMLEMGAAILLAGAFKQTWFFGAPPTGNDSSTFEVTPAVRVDGGLFQCSGNQGQQPYEPDSPDCIGQVALQQGGPDGDCCKIPAGVYGSYPVPPCKVITAGNWYEMTYRCEFRIVDTDFTVSGDHLIRNSANTFTAAQISDQRAVFIVGDTTMRKMITLVSPNEVILDSTPDAGVQGANQSAYISFWDNTLVQGWVNGIQFIDYGTAQVFWGPNVLSPTGSGLGFGSLKYQIHGTGKDASVVHAPAHRWIDDIIVSEQAIPMMSTADNTKIVMVIRG